MGPECRHCCVLSRLQVFLKKILIWELGQIKARQASFPVMLLNQQVPSAATMHEAWEGCESLHLKWVEECTCVSPMNRCCAVQCCFSQLAAWEDERCSAVDTVKTTDVDLPRRESRMMRKRIKGFPSVWFCWVFLAAMLAPCLVLCGDYKCPVVHGKLYLLLPVQPVLSCEVAITFFIVVHSGSLNDICIFLLKRYNLWPLKKYSCLPKYLYSILFLHSTTDLLTFLACGSSFVRIYLWNSITMYLLALAMTRNPVLASVSGELEGTRIPSKSQNEVVGTVRERSRLQQLHYSLLPHFFSLLRTLLQWSGNSREVNVSFI